MNYLRLLLLTCLAVPYLAQSSVQDQKQLAVQSTVTSADPDPEELISYRFRLGSLDTDYSLVAVNPTSQTARFFFRGLTPELESRPISTQHTLIPPGESLTIPAADLRWPEFDCVYVEASRRVKLSLVRNGEANRAIPLGTQYTLYDVVSDQRIGEILSADTDRAMSALDATPGSHLLLKAQDGLHDAAIRLTENLPAARSKIFVIVPLNSISGSSKE